MVDGQPGRYRLVRRISTDNALVSTEPIRSRMSAIQKTIEKRSGKYVGRFWSSSAFANPQPNPQKVCLI